eukprot:scaffold6267_cov106-Isochrysis_galbana.AAC.4
MLSLALLLCGVDGAILRAAAVAPRAAPPQCVAVAAPYDTEAFDKVVMKTCDAAERSVPHSRTQCDLVLPRAGGGWSARPCSLAGSSSWQPWMPFDPGASARAGRGLPRRAR